MRIKITCTESDYHAGLIYEVPDKKARELIAADKAFEVVEVKPEPINEKKVKYADRQNYTQ